MQNGNVGPLVQNLRLLRRQESNKANIGYHVLVHHILSCSRLKSLKTDVFFLLLVILTIIHEYALKIKMYQRTYNEN